MSGWPEGLGGTIYVPTGRFLFRWADPANPINHDDDDDDDEYDEGDDDDDDDDDEDPTEEKCP